MRTFQLSVSGAIRLVSIECTSSKALQEYEQSNFSPVLNININL